MKWIVVAAVLVAGPAGAQEERQAAPKDQLCISGFAMRLTMGFQIANATQLSKQNTQLHELLSSSFVDESWQESLDSFTDRSQRLTDGIGEIHETLMAFSDELEAYCLD